MVKVEKFVRFAAGEETFYGRLDGETIIALEGDIFGAYRENGRRFNLNEVTLLAPCRPGKAVCVGLNYRSHAAEMAEKVPEDPVIFIKPPTSVIGPNANIIYWPMVKRLDYEAELAVVIGREAHNVKEEEAEEYIFGYTVGNDVTARDLQQKDGQWTRSKGFDTFLPIGPYIVRGIDVADLRVQSFLNGELKQDGRTSQMIFCVPFLVSFISQVMTLLPGDIILTGTPEGVGPMQVGDTIEIRVEEVGSLVNRIVAPSV
ncbi:fumarylacetoacetate hydrolase family protein [Neomoorella mulderi]|uniref:Ureidoglycolate lyase n=1 Tax=Moorella mulderi DSM 14980 TaxID=1122241 RepID=A0A151AVH9_9FIRM|nr:fumarylacetoacetate hydrolase family protein [Moorella mulderi]KYH31611.1 ureidoglycolate lyase [Moorella mulderi DSM 14980]